jgi:hypothetical protein
MNKQDYINRLTELLKMNYQQLKDTSGRSSLGGDHIQGFMEAGLITGVVSRVELERVIDDAYMSIFGISFKDRSNASLGTPEVLDVPTWIRRNR